MKVSTICFPMENGRVFLANKKRGFGKGYLNGYSGKVQDIDATIADAGARELREEGGITVSPQDLEEVAIIHFYEADICIFECHVYFCRDWAGEFCETEEMAAPESYAVDNLPYDRMWPADRDWLPLVFSGKKIRARSYYSEGMKESVRFAFELM